MPVTLTYHPGQPGEASYSMPHRDGRNTDHPEHIDLKFNSSHPDNSPLLQEHMKGGSIPELLAHELQHAVQYHEGWGPGANPYMFLPNQMPSSQAEQEIATRQAMDMYKRVSGEAEARNSSARIGMSPLQRQMVSPERTADVPFDQQVVRPPVPKFLPNKISSQQADSIREGMHPDWKHAPIINQKGEVEHFGYPDPKFKILLHSQNMHAPIHLYNDKPVEHFVDDKHNYENYVDKRVDKGLDSAKEGIKQGVEYPFTDGGNEGGSNSGGQE
jgi:hypothetical protein